MKIRLIFTTFSAVIFMASPFSSMAQFLVGDQVHIGDDVIMITEQLGKGGLKTAFLGIKQNCISNCKLVLAASTPSFKFFGYYDYPLNFASNSTTSAHVRREIPMVKATVKNRTGEVYVTAMEYATSTLDDSGQWLSPSSLKLLYEDAYAGLLAMRESDALNFDIKPHNLMLMGNFVSDSNVEQNHVYLSIGDHDKLYKAGTRLADHKQIHLTPIFGAPESQIQNAVASDKAILWELATSFYLTLSGEHLLEESEIQKLGLYSNWPDQFENQINEIHERIIARLENTFKNNILMYERDKNEKQVKALKELRLLMLNGIQIDPKLRLDWPPEVPFSGRKIVAPTERLTIAPENLIRYPEQLEIKQASDYEKDLFRDAEILEKKMIQELCVPQVPNGTFQNMIKNVSQTLDQLTRKAQF